MPEGTGATQHQRAASETQARPLEEIVFVVPGNDVLRHVGDVFQALNQFIDVLFNQMFLTMAKL